VDQGNQGFGPAAGGGEFTRASMTMGKYDLVNSPLPERRGDGQDHAEDRHDGEPVGQTFRAFDETATDELTAWL